MRSEVEIKPEIKIALTRKGIRSKDNFKNLYAMNPEKLLGKKSRQNAQRPNSEENAEESY